MKRVLYLPLFHTPDSPYKYMAIGGREINGGFTNKVTYVSKRYGKEVSVESPYRSDGATGVPDVDSDYWWFHDVLCDRGTWDDGTPLSNWQCSMTLFDIRRGEQGRSRTISALCFLGTFLCGGGKARENGMFRVG